MGQSDAEDGARLTVACRPLEGRSTVYGHDLLRRAVTALVRLGWNGIPLQLAPVPSAGNMRAAARAEQFPFLCESFSQRPEVRPVAIRAAVKQISSVALRALDTVADTGSHGK